MESRSIRDLSAVITPVERHVTVDPVTDSRWSQLLSQLPTGLFHSPVWMKVVRDTYEVPVFAEVLERDGIPVAGIPWCQFDDLLGDRRITMAFSDLCDPIGFTDRQIETLVWHILADEQPWTLRALARNVPAVPVAQQRTMYKWLNIDLSKGLDSVWDGVHPGTRKNVRRAERDGVDVRLAQDIEDLREWFVLHLRLRKTKYRLLAQPYAFFESIWRTFVETGHGFLATAVHKGRIIGGIFCITWNGTCYTKFSTSDPDYLHLKPNDILRWRCVVEAHERGCQLLDLGRCSADQGGLIRFKRGFGAAVEDMHSVTYLPAGEEPEQMRMSRQVLREVTELLTRDDVPDDITERAGNLLYRFFG